MLCSEGQIHQEVSVMDFATELGVPQRTWKRDIENDAVAAINSVTREEYEHDSGIKWHVEGLRDALDAIDSLQFVGSTNLMQDPNHPVQCVIRRALIEHSEDLNRYVSLRRASDRDNDARMLASLRGWGR